MTHSDTNTTMDGMGRRRRWRGMSSIIPVRRRVRRADVSGRTSAVQSSVERVHFNRRRTVNAQRSTLHAAGERSAGKAAGAAGAGVVGLALAFLVLPLPLLRLTAVRLLLLPPVGLFLLLLLLLTA